MVCVGSVWLRALGKACVAEGGAVWGELLCGAVCVCLNILLLVMVQSPLPLPCARSHELVSPHDAL